MTLSPTALYSTTFLPQDTLLKVCSACGMPKSLDDYEKNRHGNPLPRCKKCKIEHRKKRATESISLENKFCAKCESDKPIGDFPKYSAGVNGRHSYCKKCKSKNDREYQDNLAEEKREKRRLEYLKIDPENRPLPKVCSNPECKRIGTLQPPENFRESILHPTGLLPDCIFCETGRRQQGGSLEDRKSYQKRWYEENKKAINKLSRKWRKENPQEVRRLHIIRRFRQYGVTQEWYDKTLSEQSGGCACCGSLDAGNKWNTFHVDHDHSCCSKSCHACDNCRRGLLCNVCNTKLGHLENLTFKRKAMAYLNKYSKVKRYDVDQGSLFD